MLGVSLSSCHRYHPAEVDRSYQSVFDRSCCLRPWAGGSAFGAHSRGHLCVHSRYGPMTRNLPFGGLVGRLHELGYPLPCYPSYRALIITLAGLTPAEHTSLSWTHVGSGAGAPTVGSGGYSVAFAPGLSPAPLVTFPAPAASNPACGFPALGFPVGYVPRFVDRWNRERFPPHFLP